MVLSFIHPTPWEFLPRHCQHKKCWAVQKPNRENEYERSDSAMDAGFTAFLREQKISSFHPSLGTDCSAGSLGRGQVSCSVWAAAVASVHSPNHYTNPNSHFFPYPKTALHQKGDNISLSGKAAKLKQPQSPCMQQGPDSCPMVLMSPFPFLLPQSF